MPLGAFHREIAILFADAIKDTAHWLTEQISDGKARMARDTEWRRLQASPDWFDRLVVEKVLSSAT